MTSSSTFQCSCPLFWQNRWIVAVLSCLFVFIPPMGNSIEEFLPWETRTREWQRTFNTAAPHLDLEQKRGKITNRSQFGHFHFCCFFLNVVPWKGTDTPTYSCVLFYWHLHCVLCFTFSKILGKRCCSNAPHKGSNSPRNTLHYSILIPSSFFSQTYFPNVLCSWSILLIIFHYHKLGDNLFENVVSNILAACALQLCVDDQRKI